LWKVSRGEGGVLPVFEGSGGRGADTISENDMRNFSGI